MNKLSTADRVRIVSALVEGVGVNATCRITGFAKNTVLKLLRDLGVACAAYHDEHVQHLLTKRVQCDEIWSFCYAKQKNVPTAMQGKYGVGDVWTWTAIDAETKLIVSWLVGLRDGGYATEFMKDVPARLARRVQLTTDGHRAYLDAVEDAFGGDVDYAQLIKIYGPDPAGAGAGRYSPPAITGCEAKPITSYPEHGAISTSYVERQNLTMRMHMRRFTRLTNGFSKKIQNHEYAVALNFMYYNFVKIHQMLRVTPAMAAGLTKKLWEMEDLVGLIG
jgi:IS1 family transposase